MSVHRDSEYVQPYLVYNAPVTEATKKIRQQYDVDEKTGYPRHYNWRSLAKLGPDHKPEDVFIKLGEYRPEQYYSTRIVAGAIIAVGSAAVHLMYARYRARPWWVAIYQPVGYFLATGYVLHWLQDRTHTRAGIKNQIYIDYIRKHPERFGQQVHRPKMREVLWPFNPVR